jgi:ABC-type Na+ efflux pump permease subunit
MTLLLIILAVLIIGFGITFFLMKTGKIEDKDGNNVPDVIDTKIKETKEIVEDVKVKVKRVKEETSDVVKAVKEVTKQVTDITNAAKGEPRKGRKPKQK